MKIDSHVGKRKSLGYKSFGVGILIAATGCGSAGGTVRSIVCATAHSRGMMTVGLNPAGMQSAGVSSSNEDLRGYLNKALEVAKVEPSYLNIKDVSSVVSGDSVRFLQLGGTFGDGFGVASNLLKSAFASNSGSSPKIFDFLRESFRVGGSYEEVYDWKVPRQFYEPENFTRVSSAVTASAKRAPAANLAGQNPSDQQWALKQTKFEDAMSILLANAKHKVRVAVIDTGVDLDHPDLVDVMAEGRDYVDNDNLADDENGHGTHCAGIIAGQGKGMLGVAGRLKGIGGGLIEIVPIRVLDKNGGGSSQNIDKGIRWAVEEAKVDVISMSLGGGRDFKDMTSDDLKNPILTEAIKKGVIVLVAAGNENCPLGGECKAGGMFSSKISQYIVEPCSSEGAICVGATDPDETLASYSNYTSAKEASYRTKADVNAPGTKIYSTWLEGGYKSISGTSMATPYVAGIAALLKAGNKNLNQEQVRAYLKQSLVNVPELVEKSGVGRLDLFMTAEASQNKTPAPVSPNPAPPGAVPEEKGGGSASSFWSMLCPTN